MTTSSADRTYWCFISYRHVDNDLKIPGRQWATWLHHRLETYEVPHDLVGKKNEQGEVIPDHIFPVFRDEEELPANADLTSTIYRALDNSKYMVVICSPRAVKSKYVAQEISYFKKLGKANRIMALMIDGEPNVRWDPRQSVYGFTPEQECFPEPLRYDLDSEGQRVPGAGEPIAADMRIGSHEGWTSPEAYRQSLVLAGTKADEISRLVTAYTARSDLAVLRIIAGILGVALGTLTDRQAKYQLAQSQKRARNLRNWLVAVVLLAILALGELVNAHMERLQADFQKLQAQVAEQDALKAKAQAEEAKASAEAAEVKAERARKAEEGVLNFLVFDLRDQLKPIGRLDILKLVDDKADAYRREMGVDPIDDKTNNDVTTFVNDFYKACAIDGQEVTYYSNPVVYFDEGILRLNDVDKIISSYNSTHPQRAFTPQSINIIDNHDGSYRAVSVIDFKVTRLNGTTVTGRVTDQLLISTETHSLKISSIAEVSRSL